MQQVLSLLTSHWSVKQPQISLYLVYLGNLSTYVFLHITDLTMLGTLLSSQHVHMQLGRNTQLSGKCCFTKSRIPVPSIRVDQAQENDKILKGAERIHCITNKPVTLLRYCLTAHVLGQRYRETREMFRIILTADTRHHHHHTTAVVGC